MEQSWKKVPQKDPQRKNNQTAFGGHFAQVLLQNRICVEMCGIHFWTDFEARVGEAPETKF